VHPRRIPAPAPEADAGPETTGDLLELLYGELRRMAARRMAAEGPGHTLQATALVHEVYMRVLAEGRGAWDDRAQFFTTAALAMRRVLVDRARRKHSLKRGGDRDRVALEVDTATVSADRDEVLDLDEALTRLETYDPRMAQVVQLRYFAGLSVDETASVLEVSDRTVRREWEAARLWLFRSITRARGELGNAS